MSNKEELSEQYRRKAYEVSPTRKRCQHNNEVIDWNNEIVEAFKSGWDAAIEKVIKKACNGFEDLQKYLTINVELNKLIEGFRNSVEKE